MNNSTISYVSPGNNTDHLRVLIIEEQPLYAHGLSQVLEGNLAKLVIHHSLSLRKATELLVMRSYDLVVFSINRNEIDILPKLNDFARSFRKSKLVIMSSYYSSAQLRKAQELGINGCFHKSISPQELIQSVQEVIHTDTFISARSLKIEQALESDKFGPINSLTRQERKVVDCLLRGKINSSIAKELFISTNTVHSHRKNIYKKLGVRNIQELTALGYQHNMIAT